MMRMLAAMVALALMAGCMSSGVKGAAGQPGPQGPKGPPAAGGSSLLAWGSATGPWSLVSTGPATVTVNTTDVQEGDSSFDFTVPSGGVGAQFSYGDFIAVDPTLPYRGSIAAKLAAGAGTFSAGLLAFDAAKAPLLPAGETAVWFISKDTTLSTGGWSFLAGTISGEGTASDQFPVGTRFVKPVILVNKNDIGTTRVDAFRITPDDTTRALARTQGYAGDETDNGPLAARTLVIKKLGRSTGLRVLWNDNFRVLGNNTACRWEILFNGNPCGTPGGLYFDKYEGGTNSNRHDPTSVFGTCFGIPPGTVTVSTRVGPTPGYAVTDCYTGWNTQLFSLEAEEVR